MSPYNLIWSSPRLIIVLMISRPINCRRLFVARWIVTKPPLGRSALQQKSLDDVVYILATITASLPNFCQKLFNWSLSCRPHFCFIVACYEIMNMTNMHACSLCHGSFVYSALFLLKCAMWSPCSVLLVYSGILSWIMCFIQIQKMRKNMQNFSKCALNICGIYAAYTCICRSIHMYMPHVHVEGGSK